MGGDNIEYTSNRLMPGLSLNWVLFNGFSVNITKSNFKLLEDLSQGNSAVMVENTIQAIVLSYYKILLEQEKLKVVNQVKALSRDRYMYLQLKKDFGSALTYDVLQTKNAYLNDSSNVIVQEMNVKNALMNFNLLLGEKAEKEYKLTEEFNTQLNDYDLKDLQLKFESGNKTILNQYINQEVLKNNVKLSKNRMYPTLSLSSGVDYNNSRMKYSGIDANATNGYDYYVNFSLSFNLFNGGNSKRAIANAMLNEDIGLIRIEQMKQSISNVLNVTYQLYNIRKQLYLVIEESIKTSEMNLQISTDKFKAGTINSFNYRDVQISYINASFKKLEAIYNLIDTNTELMRLTGGIISQ